ncbi:Helitron like N domain-containing protein, partial [Aphis craccivora]
KIRTLQYEKLLQYLRDFKDSDSSSDPSLEEILQKLSIKDVNEYKSIIRTVIRRPTVFLKRTIKQRMVSGFNEKLFPLWQSNMDIQFILDVYSCVRYVIEYIEKSQRGISKLMRDVVENLKSFTDLSVKEQLKKIAHPDKRTRMLKQMAVRGEMDPKSDDIFFDGLNEYYSCRPHSFEDVTLAEFGSNYEVRAWRDEKTDLLDINCKQVYETNIDQIKKLYQQFNKVKETQLDDNEIQIKGEQGHCVENTNASDVDSPKDDGKIIVHLIGNEQFKDLIGYLNDGICHWTSGSWKVNAYTCISTICNSEANLRPDIDDLSLSPVLLTSPTGKAAYGRKGLILHSAFKLPLNQFAGLLPKLSSDISNTLRCQFIIIITHLDITFQPQVMHLWATNNEVDEMNRR